MKRPAMPTLNAEEQEKIAAIQTKALIERERSIRNAPLPSGPVRIRGRDYKPDWMVVREWIAYIALHGVAVVGVYVAFFFLLIINTLVVYFIQSNAVALMIATPSLLASIFLWRLRKTPYTKESNKLWQRIEAYERGGQFRDMATELTKLAQAGNPDAQLKLAELYDTGKGVGKNQKTAIKWMRQAAKRGRTAAQYQLAMRYLAGIGTTVNLTEANKWYTAAANNGLPEAAMGLGQLYEHPRRSEPELGKAAYWYQKATDNYLLLKRVDDARAALAALKNVGSEEAVILELQARIDSSRYSRAGGIPDQIRAL